MGSTLYPGLAPGASVLAAQTIAGADPNGKARLLHTTYDGAAYIAAGGSAADAFGRLRGTVGSALFANTQLYAKDTLFFDETLVGTGASAFVSNEASVRISVSANADSVVRQTRQYFPYLPGQSQLILMTGILDDGGNNDANVRVRFGYFDANNGAFFQRAGTALSVVRRTYVTGSAVDNPVAQASWNLDTLDGNGPSGVNLDPSKANIFVIDLAWLGVGTIRLGVQINGRTIYCHEFRNENLLATVYMSTPSLPVRYEITATAAPGGTRSARHICCAVMSEGASHSAGVVQSANTGVTARAATADTLLPLISVRTKSGFERVTLDALHFAVLPTSAIDALVEVYIGATLTGASFSSASTYAEYDVSASAIATPRAKIFSDYVSAAKTGGSSFAAAIEAAVKAGSDIAGSTREPITVAVTPDGAGASFLGALTWRESP